MTLKTQMGPNDPETGLDLDPFKSHLKSLTINYSNLLPILFTL